MIQPPLIVRVYDRNIIVSMLGMSLMAKFRRREDRRGLLISEYLQDDRETRTWRSDFLAIAWREANAKARELGWIV
jgi:hypothetical protein